MSEELITNILAIGAIISHIVILIIAILLMTGKNFPILNLIGRHGIFLAFFLSLVAMLGSLYYSEIVGLEPCSLCWYQRIFSYSNVFILGLALLRKDKGIIPYGILLATIGAVIAFYHNFIQLNQSESFVCNISGITSCQETYFLVFGYITIPILSFTAFIFIILLLHLAKENEKFN